MEITYLAQSRKELSELEKRTKKLLKNYQINGAKKIFVKKDGCDEGADIIPSKGNLIEMISDWGEERGILLRSTPESIILEVGEHRYLIKYNYDEKFFG